MPIAKKVSPKPSSKNALMAAGLIAGAALGVATAFYLKTPKGHKMLLQAEKKAKELQKRMMKEIEKSKNLTKDRYQEIVEKLVNYYTKTKDISTSELPEIKEYLLGKWKEIEKEYKQLK